MPKESLQYILEQDCYNRKEKIKHLLNTGIFTKEELEEIRQIADAIYEKHMKTAYGK